MSKVLILGAGLVARPMVHDLLDHDIEVTIASRTKSKGEALISGYSKGQAIAWTVEQEDALDELVQQHDAVVSLLPFSYHPMVAQKCIAYGKPMVTTSYAKSEMRALHKQAQEAGVLLLNEIGVDPGIDHMSAMRVIDYIHRQGGEVEEFYSVTGALLAPEGVKDNPFGYKFSWSPKGVVKASKNMAKFLKNGRKMTLPGRDLFKYTFFEEYPGLGEMEIYANRDSTDYIDIYGIPEVQTMFRGTFRHKGWCGSVDALKELGMLDEEELPMEGKTYADLLAEQMGGINNGKLKQQVADTLGLNPDDNAVQAVEWLGLMKDIPLSVSKNTPFEVTTDRMIDQMMIDENDRDMVAMQHTFLASYADKKEVIKSRLLAYGTLNTETSIARTVSLPASVAVRLILKGQISLTGVHRPTIPEVYDPVLDELAEMGIAMEESYNLPEHENMHFELG